MITMKVPACRRNILDLMPPGPVVGVEIGTDTGINARELLTHRQDLFLWTVDPYGYSLGYEEHKDPGRAIAINSSSVKLGGLRSFFVCPGANGNLSTSGV